MKVILILLLVVLCGMVGYGIGYSYKQRKKFFDAYLSFLQNLKSDIGFSASKLKDIIEKSKNNTSSRDFKNFLDNYLQSITDESKPSLFKGIKFLSSDEQEDIANFFMQLGKTDIFNQIDLIKQNIEKVKLQCENVKKDSDKYCPLYTKLGVLAGLFLALVII